MTKHCAYVHYHTRWELKQWNWRKVENHPKHWGRLTSFLDNIRTNYVSKLLRVWINSLPMIAKSTNADYVSLESIWECWFFIIVQSAILKIVPKILMQHNLSASRIPYSCGINEVYGNSHFRERESERDIESLWG